MKSEKINVQLEAQKILGQFGTTEMASYRIQKLCEAYAKDQIEKDRDKLMNELTLCDWQVKMVNETPIILD